MKDFSEVSGVFKPKSIKYLVFISSSLATIIFALLDAGFDGYKYL